MAIRSREDLAWAVALDCMWRCAMRLAVYPPARLLQSSPRSCRPCTRSRYSVELSDWGERFVVACGPRLASCNHAAGARPYSFRVGHAFAQLVSVRWGSACVHSQVCLAQGSCIFVQRYASPSKNASASSKSALLRVARITYVLEFGTPTGMFRKPSSPHSSLTLAPTTNQAL